MKPTSVDVSVGNGKATAATSESSSGHEAGEQASQGFVPQTKQGTSGAGDSETQGPMSKL